MKLYLLRHADAAERDPALYPDDSLRPLTTSGHKKMLKIASTFTRMGVSVGLILCSPFLRARQTAVIARKYLGLKKDRLVLTDHLAPTGNAGQLINEIKMKFPGDDLMLVGHEPDLSEFASLLLTGKSSVSINLKKGGVCCLSVDELVAGRCATLEWLLNPAQP
jgi:phosphohistidine phosphatase